MSCAPVSPSAPEVSPAVIYSAPPCHEEPSVDTQPHQQVGICIEKGEANPQEEIVSPCEQVQRQSSSSAKSPADPNRRYTLLLVYIFLSTAFLLFVFIYSPFIRYVRKRSLWDGMAYTAGALLSAGTVVACLQFISKSVKNLFRFVLFISAIWFTICVVFFLAAFFVCAVNVADVDFWNFKGDITAMEFAGLILSFLYLHNTVAMYRETFRSKIPAQEPRQPRGLVMLSTGSFIFSLLGLVASIALIIVVATFGKWHYLLICFAIEIVASIAGLVGNSLLLMKQKDEYSIVSLLHTSSALNWMVVGCTAVFLNVGWSLMRFDGWIFFAVAVGGLCTTASAVLSMLTVRSFLHKPASIEPPRLAEEKL